MAEHVEIDSLHARIEQLERMLGMAAADQRARDAEICRAVHLQTRQRTELALLCAREIEAAP